MSAVHSHVCLPRRFETGTRNRGTCERAYTQKNKWGLTATFLDFPMSYAFQYSAMITFKTTKKRKVTRSNCVLQT